MKNFASYFIFLVFLSTTACNDDEMEGNCPTPCDLYETGIFITNEGQFQTGTGSVSYFNNSTSESQNKIYQKANKT